MSAEHRFLFEQNGMPIAIAEQLESGYGVGVLRYSAGLAAGAAYQQLKSIYLMG
jgi:hypothetical protein